MARMPLLWLHIYIFIHGVLLCLFFANYHITFSIIDLALRIT